MSDYTQATDFSDKDALTSGDPDKVIKGSDVDGELTLISTAIASKIDEPGSPSSGDVLTYNGSAWAATAPTPGVPTGTIVPYAGSSAPSGWLLCDGAAVSRTTYADLFAVTSTTYGVGDGSTTFNLPDLTGRIPAGKEASATRLTSGGGGVDGGTLGATGGSETHTLTTAEMPAHTHSVLVDGVTSYARTLGGATTWQDTSGSTGSTGGDGAHANVQPTLIVNYIIKT